MPRPDLLSDEASDEVLAVSDRLTVLRAGTTVLTAARPDVTVRGLVAAMVSETWNVFDELIAHVGVLDADVRQRIAGHLAQRGHRDRAARVRGTSGSSSLVARLGGGSSMGPGSTGV